MFLMTLIWRETSFENGKSILLMNIRSLLGIYSQMGMMIMNSKEYRNNMVSLNKKIPNIYQE